MGSPPPRKFRSRRYRFSIDCRSPSADSRSRTWNRSGCPSAMSFPTMRPPSGVTPEIPRMSQSPSPMLPSLSPTLPRPRVRNCCIFARVGGSTDEKISLSASWAGRPPMPLQTGPWTEDILTAGPTPQQPWHTTVWTSTSESSNPTTPWLQSRTGQPSAAIAIEGMYAPRSRAPTWSTAEIPPAFTAEGKDSSSVARISSVGANGSAIRSIDLTLPSSAFLFRSWTSPSAPFPRKKGVAPALRRSPTLSTAPFSTSMGGQSSPAPPPAYSAALRPAAWPMPPPHAQPIRVWTPSRSRSLSRTGTRPWASVTCTSLTNAKPAS
mmetsp:Transcript_72784/g.224828  ORF Transcript_72784/g.224828 Transcript_72784/m.224828 type:complete len:322 (-) Transcript_72784:372-1337(-)